MSETALPDPIVESVRVSPENFQPLNWRRAALLALVGIACFHAAHTPAKSGLLALGIIGYLVCLVQLARLNITRQCFYVGLTVGFACFAPQLECFWRIFGVGAVALWLVLAFWIALFLVLSHLALVRLGPKRAALLLPFLWTGLEYFRSELYYLRFSWLNVGYAFAGWPFVPLGILGMYGMGFAIAITVVLLTQLKREHMDRIRLIHVIIFVIVVALLAALLLPAYTKMKQFYPNVVVAGVQLEFPDEKGILRSLDEVLARHAQLIKTNNQFRGHTNLDLVVLPEYTLDGEPPDALKDWCRRNQKFLIIGGKDHSPGTNYFNTAFVISTNGEIVFKQVKSVPIQFFKDGLPAPEQKVWDSPWGKIGICICYDLSYTRVTDELIRQGAQMLIVPTMDVADWGRHQHELHARVAPVRAAEYRIPIFRVASSGISQGVNRSGHIQASAPFPGEGEMLFFGAHLSPGLKGSRPLDRWLAPFCVVVTGAFVMWLALDHCKRRKKNV
jgi:apolipoprotein N-acyltransferase